MRTNPVNLSTDYPFTVLGLTISVTFMNTTNKEYFALRKEQGLKAGIVSVPTPSDEEKRLKEFERLGILDKDFESDRRFNNIT